MINIYTYENESSHSDSAYTEITQRAMFFMNVIEDNGGTIISNSYHGYPSGFGFTVQRFIITYRTPDDKFNLNKIENEANRLFNKWRKEQNENKNKK